MPAPDKMLPGLLVVYKELTRQQHRQVGVYTVCKRPFSPLALRALIPTPLILGARSLNDSAVKQTFSHAQRAGLAANLTLALLKQTSALQLFHTPMPSQ